MEKLVECVPNFSEGRDQEKVKAIVAAASAVAGVKILDVETDFDHHRCVLSFVAPVNTAVDACFAVAKKAIELIDLNTHRGEHPRMGAIDVIPFIPVKGTTIEDCKQLAEKLAERVGSELDIPTYLYDHAAKIPERKDLAKVRKGQFEGLKELIGKDPERRPDFGPNRIHPTAGAVAVGARQQIINFNFNLSTHNMAAGKDIAKRVRASGGGLPAVRAKEIDLSARKQVQISTVLTDYKTTSMRKVYDEVAKLAKEHGCIIISTEIVGLLPQEALLEFSFEQLALENFNPEIQILERRLEAVAGTSGGWQEASKILCEALSNTEATPGGGSAAAISAGMGAALGMMACGISAKSKKLEESKRPILLEAQCKLAGFKNEFEKLTADDAKAFDLFMECASIPKDNPARAMKMQDALVHAAEIPLQTAIKAHEAHGLVKKTLPFTQSGVESDMNCALHLLQAAILCAAENVRINIAGIKDSAKAKDLQKKLDGVWH